MKNLVLKISKWLFTMMGFAAVSCDSFASLSPCAYGTPTMDYTVMGKVVNMRQEPLEGIKIKPRWDKWPPDSTYTDSQGAFVVARKSGALEWKSDKFYYAPLIVEDTAGVYHKDTVYIKVVQIKEGDGWYRGEFEAKDAKITMRK